MSIIISYGEEIKRKLVHLSSLWMVAATLLIPSRPARCILFAALLVLTLVSEHDFANHGPVLGKLYGRIFGRMLRQEVHPGQWVVSGGAPVLAAALFVNLLFSRTAAAVAMTILLTGDAAAALIGRKFGRHRLVNGKSLEGSLAFIAAAYLVSAAVLGCLNAQLRDYVLLLPVVILGALTELFQKQLKLDDNFLIPAATGCFFQLLVQLP